MYLNNSLLNVNPKHFLLFGIVLFLVFIAPDVLAQSGDATEYGADQESANNFIAFSYWAVKIILWCGLLWGIVKLIIMLLGGDRESWKSALLLVLIGAFGLKFVGWVADTGDLNTETNVDLTYVTPVSPYYLAGSSIVNHVDSEIGEI